MKKCFLLCEMLLLILLPTGCASEPVYIAEEIDIGELWNFSETTAAAESLAAPDTATETEALPVGDETVYYTASGSVWHLSPDCPSLSRAKDVLCGTAEQALKAGMARACKRCE